MCNGGDESDCEDEDIIPGDNDSEVPATPPSQPGTAENLTKIPAQGGDVPIVLEPQK